VQLRDNKIPKGSLPLKDLFDKSDHFKKSLTSNVNEQVVQMNVGFIESSRERLIKIVNFYGYSKKVFSPLLGEHFVS
jgi:hypothetical protein